MRVTVLLFGSEATAVGRDSVTVEISGPITGAELREHLNEHWPALRPMLPSARFAVNHAFAAPDQVIRATDEIALIGLVGGG